MGLLQNAPCGVRRTCPKKKDGCLNVGREKTHRADPVFAKNLSIKQVKIKG
jgi:hypothetical protein